MTIHLHVELIFGSSFQLLDFLSDEIVYYNKVEAHFTPGRPYRP